MKLRVGTRGSKLALAQTAIVADLLRAAHSELEIEVVTISTRGDRDQARPLSEIGDRRVFVGDVETALREGTIDVAVHSAKDLASDPSPGLRLAAFPQRADPRDVLVSAGGLALDELPSGARVGTSSARRTCQVRHARADVAVVDVRGNVDTRLRKLEAGEYEAIVLAAAGLERLGVLDRRMRFLEPDEFVPAPAQGALALQCREDDAATQGAMAALDHGATRIAVEAERAFLVEIDGGCRLPAGAYATVGGSDISIIGMLGDADGRIARDRLVGAVAEGEALGAELARRLVAELR